MSDLPKPPGTRLTPAADSLPRSGRSIWNWAAWWKTVALFALAGPLIGVVCVLIYFLGADLLGRLLSVLASRPFGEVNFDAVHGMIFYGFMFGSILGFPFAAVTGLIYASGAAKLRWTRLRHALGASLIGFFLCFAAWRAKVDTESLTAAEWSFRELWRNGPIFLLPSLCAASVCWALSRQWWRQG
jgi:hypothetical protein